MSCNKKKLVSTLLTLIIILSVAGCTQAGKESSNKNASSTESTQVSVDNINNSEMFSDSDKEIGYDESTAISIALSDDGIQCGSDTVKISGNTVTITNEGTYILSGSLTNGQIVVDAEKTDKLQLVLNGTNINCDTSAAIYVKQADKVFVTLANGTQNSLSNRSEFVAIDENSIDSVIFSKDDLTLNGTGTLTINATYGHGIVSKDDLIITSGNYNITAKSHAISGNDSVRVADGSFKILSEKDGIQAENQEDTSLGFVYIGGGNFEITSSGDGISASGTLQIETGIFNIKTGEGSVNGETKQEETFRPGSKNQETATTQTDTVSTKGMKATGNLIINGGEIVVDCEDDSIHSNANIVIKEGTLNLSTGDDGVHADGNVTISGSNLLVTKSYEGIEGQSIDINGGVVSVTASDDGLNAAGGNDQSGFGGGMERDNFSADENVYIKILGGKLTVDASGDGIDSNGNLYVSGGETYVSGPSNSGNGALDYGGDAQINGGVFVAVGESGMAQNFGTSSTQGVMMVNLSSNESNAEIVLKDSSGKALASYTPQKAYNSVVVSCPEIKKGESYTLVAGSQSTEVKMTSLVYSSTGEMGGGFSGGRR